MRQLFLSYVLLSLFAGCEQKPDQKPVSGKDTAFAGFLTNYYDGRMKLSPLEATQNAYGRYNDLLPADFTDGYRDTLKNFYLQFRDGLGKFDRTHLDSNDRVSYDMLVWELDIRLEGLKFHSNYFPTNQFTSLPLTMGQLGSGDGFQPFLTVKDHEDWLLRAKAFSVWVDSAIVYFRHGIAANMVLPRSLVVKMIPQMRAMEVADPVKSLFYGPVAKLKELNDTAASGRLQKEYLTVIREQVVPAYKRLGDFLQNEYLPKARASSGLGAIPDGAAYYAYLVKDQTTTLKSPEEIYATGLKEVARIRGLMDSVKNAVGFKGDLPAFFKYMNQDKKFMPYKTPAEVLAAFDAIHKKMEPNLQKMFMHVPKTGFEIRQTEAFRAESASAEYLQGSADGKRPGIFYVPILDATTFNSTSGMESLFLHEAIPGHHYQISLQQEDTLLPDFRRFQGGNNAYIEGWALYCESLGKELGLYTDPYQYMGALGDEIHRAIRLVVDVAIHTKGMTREEAIKYMRDNEAIGEQGATAEIERYMAIPGQALSYKIGALKIRELREKYTRSLGGKFNIAAFHDEVLKDGAMPMAVFEKKMDAWAARQ